MRMDCTSVAELHDLAQARRVVDAFLDRCPGRRAFASVKLDGWFCEVRVLPGGLVEWTSKAGNPLRRLAALDRDMRGLLEFLRGRFDLSRATFDAEITHKSGLLEDVTATLNDARGSVYDLQVNLYDIRLDWLNLYGRDELLAEAVNRLGHPLVSAVRHRPVDHPLVYATHIIDRGGEGVVLKNGHEVYDPLLSPGWCKVVRADTLDLPVLRVKEGRGNWAGMAAAFVCLMPDSRTVEVMAGEATHMELRHYLHHPPAVIAVKHRGWTRHGIPRNASFVRPRPDKAPVVKESPAISDGPTV